ncbi:MAG TPA: methyltransferase domain-containing protein [Acidimicrobiales bacterium]|nr:methyltransferase domain-containing protein [Acidimicrobiales bacterium]
MTGAAGRWRDELARWAVPDDIRAAAPASPWRFPPALFARRAEQALAGGGDGPSRRRALEALPAGGSVLDVGVGGGAASLPLVPPAGLVVGVDDAEGMLEAFAAAAGRLGVAHREVAGTWPGVAGRVEPADVVVCHHVLYNVADLVPFAAALTDRARHRVVVEISADHPTAHLNPLWLALHGLERPTSPTAGDAVAVLEEMGLDVAYEAFERPWEPFGADRAGAVAMARERLCVGPERDAEVEVLLERAAARSPVRRGVTVWWPGTASGG